MAHPAGFTFGRAQAALVACALAGALSASAQAARPHTLWRSAAHSEVVTSVAFSPDGQRLATGSFDRTAKVWTAAGVLEHTLDKHTEPVGSVAFTPDGEMLATGRLKPSDHTARMWRVSDGQAARTLSGGSTQLSHLAFARSGDLMASTGYGMSVSLWNWRTGMYLRSLAEGVEVGFSLAFSPDATLLVVPTRRSREVLIYRVADGKLLHTLAGHTGFIHSVAFSPDGRTVASGGQEGAIRLWSVADGRETARLTAGSEDIRSIAFSPDGRTLLAGSTVPQGKRIIGGVRLWSLKEKQQVQFHEETRTGVESVAFAPDGKRFAYGCQDGSVVVAGLPQ